MQGAGALDSLWVVGMAAALVAAGGCGSSPTSGGVSGDGGSMAATGAAGVSGAAGSATAGDHGGGSGTEGIPIGGSGAGLAGSKGGADGVPVGSGGSAAGAGVGGVGGSKGGSQGPPPTGGTGGTGGGASTAGLPKLPNAVASCPAFANGATVQIPRKNTANGSMPVVIYIDANAKSKPDPGGPLILYYHATGGQPSEVTRGFGTDNIAAVTSKGGVVAAFTTTSCSVGCTTTDDLVWWAEDADVQDTIVACAIQQAKIDTKHIHALGFSAGALHAAWVGLARSNYMASVISYSGGYPPWPGTDTVQDPTNHVASIMTYGDSSDVVVVSFPTQSKTWYSTFQPKGYYTLMCNHTGGHQIDAGVAPLSLRFFEDHPYEVSPEPYVPSPPSTFPSYCKNSP